MSVCDGDSPCPIRTPDVATELAVPTLLIEHAKGGACDGDSGGPAIAQVAGTTYVVGVSSLVQDRENNCENARFNVYVRAGAYEGFIEAALDDSLVDASERICQELGGDGDPACTGQVQPAADPTLGGPCEEASDCNSRVCLFEGADGWPQGGACIEFCESDADCLSEAVCVLPPPDLGDIGYCASRCRGNAACKRDDYTCWWPPRLTSETSDLLDGYCNSRCLGDADCPPGQRCDAIGACGPPPAF
jgi:hypothetical protein